MNISTLLISLGSISIGYGTYKYLVNDTDEYSFYIGWGGALMLSVGLALL